MIMKKITILLSAFAVVFGMASCNDELELRNPNNQTTYDFGDTVEELQEAVIACYSVLRFDGTYSRVGYTMDAVRGDEVWNSSQQWYYEYDNLDVPITNDLSQWIWRDFFYVVTRCNYVLQQVEKVSMSEDSYNEIKGQALFMRGLAYYELATYFQTVPVFNDYSQYSSLESMYRPNVPQEDVFAQVDADLSEAMRLLPSRDKGGEWAEGRATCGSAAGYYARSLMFQHKFTEAYAVLKDIISGVYGSYSLVADYGDNFKEGTAENNEECLFEVQYLDFGQGGTNEVWTPVNLNPDATQGHAIESNYASQDWVSSWGDLAVSPWLYNLFKKETCTDGRLDPRLYWTVCSYEAEYDTYTGVKTDAYPSGDPRCNIMYKRAATATPNSNTAQGGIPIAKYTNARNNLYETVTNGLRCGINLRMMRYSDVLLLAAECENELNGVTQTAIDYINEVRDRVALAPLKTSDFRDADHLFEWIANVERPKELGCEHGRGIDLIRWGFFYDAKRLEQLKLHGAYVCDGTANTKELTIEEALKTSYDNYQRGHEYFPYYQGTLNNNPSLTGNSANTNTDNSEAFFAAGKKVRPVVEL